MFATGHKGLGTDRNTELGIRADDLQKSVSSLSSPPTRTNKHAAQEIYRADCYCMGDCAEMDSSGLHCSSERELIIANEREFIYCPVRNRISFPADAACIHEYELKTTATGRRCVIFDV